MLDNKENDRKQRSQDEEEKNTGKLEGEAHSRKEADPCTTGCVQLVHNLLT